MASKFKVYKKKSPNGQLTVYLSHRDFLEDEGKQLVPVAGVVMFREEDLRGDQLFCLVNLSYRYGHEEDETMAVTFQRTLQLINAPLVLETTAGKTLDQEGEDEKSNVEDGRNGGKVSGKGWKVKILGYDEELEKEKEMEEELAQWRTRRMEENDIKFQREITGKANEVNESPSSTTDKNGGNQNDPTQNCLLQQEGDDKQMQKENKENETEYLDKHERTHGESNAEECGSLQMKEDSQTASPAGTEIALAENGETPPSVSESRKENLSMQATEETIAESENKGTYSENGVTQSKSVEESLNNSEQDGNFQVSTEETKNKEESNEPAKEDAIEESNEPSLNKVLMDESNRMSGNEFTKSNQQKDVEAATDVDIEQNESEAGNKNEETVENVTKINTEETNVEQTEQKSSDDCIKEKVSNDDKSEKIDDGKEEIVKTEYTEQDSEKIVDSENEKTENGVGDSTCKVKVTNDNNHDDSLLEENVAKRGNLNRSKSYPCSPQPHLTDAGQCSPLSVRKMESVNPASSVNETLRVSPQPSLGDTQQQEADVSRDSPQPSVKESQNTPTPRNSSQSSKYDTPNIPLSRNSPQPSVRGTQDTPLPRQLPQPSINEIQSSPLPRSSPQHSFGGHATPTPRNSPQPSVRETEGSQYLLPGEENYMRSPQPLTHSGPSDSPTPSGVSGANCSAETAAVDEHRWRGITAHPLEDQMARARLPYFLPVPTADQLQLLAPPDAGGDLTGGQTTGDIAYDVTVLQTRLMEKLQASSEGERCVPFTVEVPRVAPNSVTLVPGRVVSNNPVGITYELQVYAASEVTEAPPKYKSTSFAVRKQQLVPEDLEAKIQSNVATNEKFICSPGHVELSLTLDKDIYFHGEVISAHVTLDNGSRKTVKSVRCDVVQNVNMTITKTHFSRVVTSVESRDGCPVQPNYKFGRTFQLVPDVRYNKTNAGAALIGQFRDVDSQLASSTLPLNENSLDEALGIVVSYSVRVTLLFGAIRGEMNVESGIKLVDKRPEDYVGKIKASIMEKLKALTVTDNVISIEEFASIRRLKSIDDCTGP